MRAPVHSRCRSGLLLAVVGVILLSSVDARAAGHRDDEGFFQAVVQGRKDAREAYEKKMKEEKLAAEEASRMREREASVRGTETGPFSGRRGATGGNAGGSASGDGPTEVPTAPEGGIPWTLIMLGGVIILGVVVVRQMK
jgi:hypothetical protein